MTSLPIEPVLPALKNALRARLSAVLVADPGAGKTTRVPLALLDEPWLAGRRILMLEPRRLAARAAARYMAASLGETVGETVGYRVRLDTRVGPATRIEVITEGVLTRMLQADPMLAEAGIVIFDEFHERSLHADLGLALCLESRAVLREDLRILVMSATLDAVPVAALLDDAPVVASAGRTYPVATHYLSRPVEGDIEPAVARAVMQALDNEQGDVLAFLPGAGEIRRVQALLTKQIPEARGRIVPLHGNLPQQAQDLALAPIREGVRKIVLATSIAETSLTVEGVRIVVDSGLMRVPRFSPRTGMSRLATVPVSRAAADQRRGRAGRLGPGVCYRLWTEHEERLLPPHSLPEIAEADLAPLALELAAWGTADPAELRWLDPPPAAAYAQARELLRRLGALDERGKLTPHGRRMADLGFHPRLAHMILRAMPLGHGGLACELAALLSERDILRGEPTAPNADLRLRVEALRAAVESAPRTQAASPNPPVHAPDPATVRRIRAEARHWQRMLGIAPGGESGADACGLLLAFAYPDRIAQRRGDGRYLLLSGRGASLAAQPLARDAYLVAAELDDSGPEGRITLAAPVELSDLERHFGEQIEAEQQIFWDRAAQSVRAREHKRLGALLLQDVPLNDPDPHACLAALLRGIAEEGLALLPWTKAALQLRQRMNFLRTHEPGWPDVSDPALAASLEGWLGPHLYGLRNRNDLQRLRLAEILEAMLTWEQRRELETAAPTHLAVPGGSRLPIDYSDPASPVLAVRLQELFGVRETPRILHGKVPLTLHLLSPALRPVQVTRDLGSFWRNAYFEVKKDLKGRYPKHYWPDDPLAATPTNRTRPRSESNPRL